MIVLPSRGRPESLARFFQESQPVEPGVLLLDQDDAHRYQDVVMPNGWSALIGPRAGYVALLNRAFACFPNEPWYACWGDDVLCRPAGWDTYLAKSADSDRIAFGDDCINGERTCCLPFIGGDLVRKVGWLAYPKLNHLYCDTVWHAIGQALGVLSYHPEIITEHCHWSTGKQPYDLTAQERNIAGDREAYAGFLDHELREAVTRCSH